MRPVLTAGNVIGREPAQLGADLIQRQANALREDDERDAPKYRSAITAVAGSVAFRFDQAPSLVEAQRRRSHAAAALDLADGEQGEHTPKKRRIPLDFKFG
jgi:hypothetical protein